MQVICNQRPHGRGGALDDLDRRRYCTSVVAVGHQLATLESRPHSVHTSSSARTGRADPGLARGGASAAPSPRPRLPCCNSGADGGTPCASRPTASPGAQPSRSSMRWPKFRASRGGASETDGLAARISSIPRSSSRAYASSPELPPSISKASSASSRARFRPDRASAACCASLTAHERVAHAGHLPAPLSWRREKIDRGVGRPHMLQSRMWSDGGTAGELHTRPTSASGLLSRPAAERRACRCGFEHRRHFPRPHNWASEKSSSGRTSPQRVHRGMADVASAN